MHPCAFRGKRTRDLEPDPARAGGDQNTQALDAQIHDPASPRFSALWTLTIQRATVAVNESLTGGDHGPEIESDAARAGAGCSRLSAHTRHARDLVWAERVHQDWPSDAAHWLPRAARRLCRDGHPVGR